VDGSNCWTVSVLREIRATSELVEIGFELRVLRGKKNGEQMELTRFACARTGSNASRDRSAMTRLPASMISCGSMSTGADRPLRTVASV
jgi:hypothetical protein